MPAVTELDVHQAVRAAILAAASRPESAWFATVGSSAIHFGRRPPNAGLPPYIVIATEEQDDPAPESDGALAQRFLVEVMAVIVGPTAAESANAALVALDPRWNGPTGMTLTNAAQGIVAVQLKPGKLRLIEPLIAGADEYMVSRRWIVWTSAFAGSTT